MIAPTADAHLIGHVTPKSSGLSRGVEQPAWQVSRARAIAEKAWAHHPCVERMRVRWAPPYDGRASTAAWADEVDCVVTFNDGRRLGWPEFCTRLLHEAGHLAGYRDVSNPDDPATPEDESMHSADPNNLMYAEDLHVYGRVRRHGRWVDVGGDARCANRGRSYLGLEQPRRGRHGETIGGSVD
jgi:hypothetical protein